MKSTESNCESPLLDDFVFVKIISNGMFLVNLKKKQND